MYKGLETCLIRPDTFLGYQMAPLRITGLFISESWAVFNGRHITSKNAILKLGIVKSADNYIILSNNIYNVYYLMDKVKLVNCFIRL